MPVRISGSQAREFFATTKINRPRYLEPITHTIAFREGTSEDVKRWIEEDVIRFGLLCNVEDPRNAPSPRLVAIN